MSADAATPEGPEPPGPALAAQPAATGRNWRDWLDLGARLIARVWVVGLLLAAALVAGAAFTARWQAEQRLEALRASPGPDAYAVVAYRRELERQIAEMRTGRVGEATPIPPARPVLLEDIDIARARNQAVAQAAQGNREAQAPRPARPARATPVVIAPE